MKEVIPGKSIDIRGLQCPYTFVRAKIAIESMEQGQVLEILLDNEEAAKGVPKSMTDHGQKVLKTEKSGLNEWIILVKKERA